MNNPYNQNPMYPNQFSGQPQPQNQNQNPQLTTTYNNQPQYQNTNPPNYYQPQAPIPGNYAPNPQVQGYVQTQMIPNQFMGQMPGYNMPDPNQMMTSYHDHKMSMGKGGLGYTFVKFLGPNNESKWESNTVPIGYQSIIRAYILPPWAAGKYVFAISYSHFWKSVSKPQGASLGCPGPERCKICQASRLAIESPDLGVQKRAKDWGSVNTNFLYQVALLDTPQIHFNNGVVQPAILRAGATLHKAIGNLFEERSINICNPELGRPIRIKKTKTGPGKFDVEYSCIDEDPQPLPQNFWGLLSNLIDLDSVFKDPTEEEMQKAVIDMGFGNIGMVNPNMSYNPGVPHNMMQPNLVHQSPIPQSPIPQSPIPQSPIPQSPIPQSPIPQSPIPNNQYQYNGDPNNLAPPPVVSGNYNGPQYYPQPSQPQPGQQASNVIQNPVVNMPVNRNPIRTPITNQGQTVQQQPMSLEQLQNSIRGNNGNQ